MMREFIPRSLHLEILLELRDAVASEPSTEKIWGAAQHAFQRAIGHAMFTVLRHLPETGEVSRLYSSRPDVYPVAGRKVMGPTPWGEQVLTRGEPFLGLDKAALRWAYPDHERLFAMGVETALNATMRLGGQTLGTINLTAGAGYYRPDDVAIAQLLAAILTPALLREDAAQSHLERRQR